MIRPSSEGPRAAGSAVAWSDEYHLHTRVSAEFREMPGLTLTLAQASRLFSIDAHKCERVLGALVERGVLRTDGQAFARTDDNR